MPPQRERIPTGWWPSPQQHENSPSLRLSSSQPPPPFVFTFETVRHNVFRTTFSSETHPVPPYPSVPRMETQLDGIQPVVTSTEKSKSIKIGYITASVHFAGETPLVSISIEGQPFPILQDLPNRSYVADGEGVSHYTRYNRKTLHVGLGEKAAPMNLSGRRFELSATDSFGYDVYRTDPLYKNIPLLINATPDGCVATFSTSQGRGQYSIGAEMDGMHGFFKVYRQDYGGLEEYIIVGKTLKEVVRTYADLAGYPLLVPRWAFGYISGGMKYSMLDDPPAHEAMMQLARKLKELDIPCSAHQMSSGYTVSATPPRTRNVFTWNRHRFPDPEGWIHEFHKQGIRLIANIKPYVIGSHPEYEKLRAAGALFTDPHTGKPAVTKLWSAGGGESADGGHIDFTSKAGFDWWYNGVKELARQGIDCMWNDNNEYTIPDDDWKCALDLPLLQIPPGAEKRPQVGVWGRNVHTELHGKASHDALVDVNPDVRPFVLTRSATAGTMRYAASSWSGDNVTSWEGMKGANALSLNAGMSLLQCYGHDIGGFEGEQPSPELLLRWVQLGIHSPRFAINCFKTASGDNSVGDVIEPWMYPAITHLVRKAIKRRYALIPYIYSLMLESNRTATPPQRWTGWGYESDPEVWTSVELTNGETQYWFGDALLIGGVYEPGVSKSRMYLPKAADAERDEGFMNTNAPFQYLASGQWVDIDAEWHGAGIPVLAKVGAAIPVGRDVQVLSPGEQDNVANLPLDDYRGVEIFPPKGRSLNGQWHTTTWYEDDGVSAAHKNRVSSYTFAYTATEAGASGEIKVKFSKDESSGFEAPWKTLVVILPSGDERTVVSDDGRTVVQLGVDAQGRNRFELQ
ncbi:f86aca90-81dd-4f33-92a2-3672da7c08b7 [Thermothielavioides terrestris]|uniref:alpha-glucosidase n=2 Tax=Thermothielavioides terrestris TaxID=2587410 RepID=G2QW07_THETT|nr:glycoside hydrolase family 31 protein [Thermothielavioides terrestris NRRL 8126]AEO62178.1 glycoside hydrolase family 31 protein [Thermothielavioides terrestris NRRL 8126]SPQ25019.1 f86aca90-81dd-4f33-92a2-3672da7c08b7 [Thermothielavioides terrestris]